MEEPNEEMRQKIKKIIMMLRKIRDREQKDNQFMSDHDKAMIQGLDFLLENFENLDIRIDSFSKEMIPPPFQNMLDPIIKMLGEDLGQSMDGSLFDDWEGLSELTKLIDDEEDKSEEQTQTSLPVPDTQSILESIDENIPEKHRVMMAIQQVDEMLKKAEPGSAIADELLDRRIDLLHQLKELS